jgi:GTPase SAR1 family protein
MNFIKYLLLLFTPTKDAFYKAFKNASGEDHNYRVMLQEYGFAYRDIHCPFCEEIHSLYDCHIECKNKTCRKDEYDDEVDPFEHSYCLSSSSCNERRFLYCNEMSKKQKLGTAVIDPLNYKLDIKLFMHKNIKIDLLGLKSTGKTLFIAALINEINKGALKNHNVTTHALNEKIEEEYEKRFKYLFKPPYKTPGSTPPDRQIPFVYILEFKKRKQTDKLATIVLQDVAGELTHELEKNCYYIRNSDGIILLYDPKKNETIKTILSGDKYEFPIEEKVDLKSESVKTEISFEQFMGRMYHFLHDIFQATEFPIPLALSLTKIDIIDNHITAFKDFVDQKLHDDSIKNQRTLKITDKKNKIMNERKIKRNIDNKIDKNENYKISGDSENIELFISAFEIQAVIDKIGSFTNRKYFGIAPIGKDKNDNQELDNGPSPIRILEPLKWLLEVYKYI